MNILLIKVVYCPENLKLFLNSFPSSYNVYNVMQRYINFCLTKIFSLTNFMWIKVLTIITSHVNFHKISLMNCISWLRPLQQNTIGWVASSTDIYFFTVLKAGRPRSRCKRIVFLLQLLSLSGSCLPCTHMVSSLCMYTSVSLPHLTRTPGVLDQKPTLRMSFFFFF